MRAGEPAGDRQPEPGSAASPRAASRRTRRSKIRSRSGPGTPGPVSVTTIPSAGDLEGERAAAGHRADRVAGQVGQDLREPGRVAEHARRPARDLDGHFGRSQPHLVGLRPEPAPAARTGARSRSRARVEPGEVQQVGDELAGPPRLADHQQLQPFPLLRPARPAGCCSSASAAACTPARGVRSSWAASATNRRVRSSDARAARSAPSRASSAESNAAAARPSSVPVRSGASRPPRPPETIVRASRVIASSGASANRTASSNADRGDEQGRDAGGRAAPTAGSARPPPRATRPR